MNSLVSYFKRYHCKNKDFFVLIRATNRRKWGFLEYDFVVVFFFCIFAFVVVFIVQVALFLLLLLSYILFGIILYIHTFND